MIYRYGLLKVCFHSQLRKFHFCLPVVSWQSEITLDEDLTGVRSAVITTVTDEDLTGVRPVDTSGGFADWTKEGPVAFSSVQSPGGGGWADFSTFPSPLNDL